jgi:adenine phosphoribosyltransferase
MLGVDDLERLIRNVRDFPIEGVVFKDITTLLTHPGALASSVSMLENEVSDLEFDAIASIESRGFVFGSVLAARHGLPLVLIRKPGKLPADTHSMDYALEYGTNTVEMHRDSLSGGSRVLIVDDLIATGGSALASAKLIELDGAVVAGTAFVINLEFLGGRQRLADAGYKVRYLIDIQSETVEDV